MAMRSFATTSSRLGRPARLAVIGCGGWAQGWHLSNISHHPEAEVACLVDQNPHPQSTFIPGMRPLADLSKEHNDAPVFSTVDDLLADEALCASIDGVICSTNHAGHYDVGVKALARGMHVLMEKPMTTDVAEAAGLAAAAERAAEKDGLAFLLNNTANWQPGTRRAAELLTGERRAIGEIKHASVLFGAPLGWLFEDPEQLGWVEASGTMTGNGFGWGQFSHTFAWLVSDLAAPPAPARSPCIVMRRPP